MVDLGLEELEELEEGEGKLGGRGGEKRGMDNRCC